MTRLVCPLYCSRRQAFLQPICFVMTSRDSLLDRCRDAWVSSTEQSRSITTSSIVQFALTPGATRLCPLIRGWPATKMAGRTGQRSRCLDGIETYSWVGS